MESLLLAASLLCALGAPTPVRAVERTETKAEYVLRARAELDALGGRVDALELRAGKTGRKALEGIQSQLAALKARRRAAKGDFANLERASGKTWAGLKTRVDRAIVALDAGLDEAGEG